MEIATETKKDPVADSPSDEIKPYTVLVANKDGEITEVHREVDLDSADTKSEILKIEHVKRRECVWIMVCPRHREDEFLND